MTTAAPRKGYQGGFARPKGLSVLSDSQWETILIYAREHGAKQAADRFCVSRERIEMKLYES